VPAVALGTQQTVTATATIPLGTRTGTYVVQACVDAAKLVAEASDDNNCGTSSDTINVQ
jgi:CARDB